MRYLLENHEGNLQYYTRQQVWAYLKAERQWADKVRQWLRAEGVPRHVLIERRLGRPEAPRRADRAARRARQRAFLRSVKRAKRIEPEAA